MYLDRKYEDFLIEAFPNEYHDYFYVAFRLPDESIVSVECIPDNYPATTVCTYDNLEEFITGVSWREYMVDGIIHSDLKKMLEERGLLEENSDDEDEDDSDDEEA